MKKTLLIAAAALAAGIISSQAQPVYSQNVVGYVNQTFIGGGAFNVICNPLTDGKTNNAETVLGSALQGGENLYIWNKSGGGYFIYSYVGPGNGTYNWVDAGGVPIPGGNGDGTVPAPLIPPGQGFVYSCGTKETNTWTGTVLSSNSIPLNGGGALNMVSSAIPFTGNLETQTNFNAILQGGDNVYVWNYNGGGYYIYSYVGPGNGTYNWVDAGGVAIPGGNGDGTVPGPNISVGQGFFYSTASNTNWVQQYISQ